MAYKKPMIEATMEETGWSEFKGNNQLPMSAHPMIERTEMFKYPGGWYKAFYKGDVETTDKWIIVTANGGFYKVNAIFMVWTYDGVCVARWTVKSMKEAVCAKFKGLDIPFDPNYQT